MVYLLRSLVCVALLGVTLPAQGTVEAGTGCPGTASLFPGGSTRIGATLTVQCLVPTASVQTVLLLGECADNPLPIPASLACQAGCTLGIAVPGPVVILDTRRVPITFHIPNDPSLVGITLCMQCVDNIFGRCLVVHQAMRVTVTR